MVAEADRLRDLQMREAGHDGVGVLRGHFDQRELQSFEQFADGVDLVTQPQAHIGSDLVVAAAPGVQTLARVAHQLSQPRFDVQVNVFEFQLPFEATGFNVLRDLRHAALNVGQVLRADDVLCVQHVRVRQTALYVGPPQTLVEEDAGGVALHQLAHGFGEQGGPSLGFAV